MHSIQRHLTMKTAQLLLLALCAVLTTANSSKDDVTALGFDCKPSDGWKTIFTYENGHSSPSKVTYKRTTGTFFANGTPSQAEKDAFFKKFGDALGESGRLFSMNDSMASKCQQCSQEKRVLSVRAKYLQKTLVFILVKALKGNSDLQVQLSVNFLMS